MIEVGAAIIEDARGRILIARRRAGKAQAGLWEFPGGKREAGETIADCLKRELLEEMNIVIEPYAHFGDNDHRYGSTEIRLIAYRARYAGGDIALADHDDCRWVTPDELAGYAFAPADVIFAERLQAENR